MTKKINGLGTLPQSGIDFPDPDKGYICPCCGSFVKRYRRRMNANMVMPLIVLFRKKKFGFIHVENFMRQVGFTRSGDFAYLVHWGLLEKLEGERPDGSKKNGFYKLTEKGRAFVQKQITVPKTLLYCMGKAEGFEGDEVTIVDALGKRFDYAELMKGDYTIQKQ